VQGRLLAWAAFGVMTLGLVVTAIPLLGNQATVLWTFYPPMRVEWTFYGGLTLVVVATWLVALTLYRTYAVLAGAAPRCMDAPGSVHVLGHLRHVDHRLTWSRCRNALPAHSMVPRMGERHRSPPGADALLVLGGRSSASRANGRDGMPTPVDYFRHRPTSHRFLKETVDLPSCMELLDPSRHF